VGEVLSLLSRVEVVDLERGRLVVVAPDNRDDFSPWVRRTTKRLAELVEPGDDVVLSFASDVFRSVDVSEFCRWLWDDAKALLRAVSWSAAGVSGAPAGVTLGALEAWSFACGPDSPDHRHRRFRFDVHHIVRRQLFAGGSTPALPSGRVVTRVASLVKRAGADARRSGTPDPVVVVADLLDHRGREILDAAPSRRVGDVIRHANAALAGAWLPRREACRRAGDASVDCGRKVIPAERFGGHATLVAGGAFWVDPLGVH
jgi:hypothetical protein